MKGDADTERIRSQSSKQLGSAAETDHFTRAKGRRLSAVRELDLSESEDDGEAPLQKSTRAEKKPSDKSRNKHSFHNPFANNRHSGLDLGLQGGLANRVSNRGGAEDILQGQLGMNNFHSSGVDQGRGSVGQEEATRNGSMYKDWSRVSDSEEESPQPRKQKGQAYSLQSKQGEEGLQIVEKPDAEGWRGRRPNGKEDGALNGSTLQKADWPKRLEGAPDGAKEASQASQSDARLGRGQFGTRDLEEGTDDKGKQAAKLDLNGRTGIERSRKEAALNEKSNSVEEHLTASGAEKRQGGPQLEMVNGAVKGLTFDRNAGLRISKGAGRDGFNSAKTATADGSEGLRGEAENAQSRELAGRVSSRIFESQQGSGGWRSRRLSSKQESEQPENGVNAEHSLLQSAEVDTSAARLDAGSNGHAQESSKPQKAHRPLVGKTKKNEKSRGWSQQLETRLLKREEGSSSQQGDAWRDSRRASSSQQGELAVNEARDTEGHQHSGFAEETVEGGSRAEAAPASRFTGLVGSRAKKGQLFHQPQNGQRTQEGASDFLCEMNNRTCGLALNPEALEEEEDPSEHLVTRRRRLRPLLAPNPADNQQDLAAGPASNGQVGKPLELVQIQDSPESDLTPSQDDVIPSPMSKQRRSARHRKVKWGGLGGSKEVTRGKSTASEADGHIPAANGRTVGVQQDAKEKANGGRLRKVNFSQGKSRKQLETLQGRGEEGRADEAFANGQSGLASGEAPIRGNMPFELELSDAEEENEHTSERPSFFARSRRRAQPNRAQESREGPGQGHFFLRPGRGLQSNGPERLEGGQESRPALQDGQGRRLESVLVKSFPGQVRRLDDQGRASESEEDLPIAVAVQERRAKRRRSEVTQQAEVVELDSSEDTPLQRRRRQLQSSSDVLQNRQDLLGQGELPERLELRQGAREWRELPEHLEAAHLQGPEAAESRRRRERRRELVRGSEAPAQNSNAEGDADKRAQLEADERLARQLQMAEEMEASDTLTRADAEFARRLQLEEEARMHRPWDQASPPFEGAAPNRFEATRGAAFPAPPTFQEAAAGRFRRASELAGGFAAALEAPPQASYAENEEPRRRGAARWPARGGAMAARGAPGRSVNRGGGARGGRGGGGVRLRYARGGIGGRGRLWGDDLPAPINFGPGISLEDRMELLAAMEEAAHQGGGMGFAGGLGNLGLMAAARDFDERDYEMLLQLDEGGPSPSRPRGASKGEIDSLPTNKASAADIAAGPCTICLDTPEEGDVIKRLPCMHIFHKKCIDDWLQRQPLCPICKASVRSG